MDIAINSTIVLLLISIVPAGIALTVSLLRIETIRGDARAVVRDLQDMRMEYARIIAQFTQYTDQLSTLSSGVHAAGLRMTGLDESLTSLSNKWNSRERADRQATKRQQREEDDEEIPGTKQTAIDFTKIPGAIKLPMPVAPVKNNNIYTPDDDEFLPPGW